MRWREKTSQKESDSPIFKWVLVELKENRSAEHNLSWNFQIKWCLQFLNFNQSIPQHIAIVPQGQKMSQCRCTCGSCFFCAGISMNKSTELEDFKSIRIPKKSILKKFFRSLYFWHCFENFCETFAVDIWKLWECRTFELQFPIWLNLAQTLVNFAG